MSENQSNISERIINIIVNCPNCNIPVLIEQLNCRIFRHGILRSNGKQINPHSSKEMCDYYIANERIYGCGKPFRIENINSNLVAVICDYI